jgi:N-methylhydantoinase A
MQSSGGLASIEQAVERPVRTLESGPAAGVVGAAAFGETVGFGNVISFDMGGTTAKAAVVSGGVPASTTYFELQRVESRRGSGLPVDIPALDLVEVGTGGGSIAEVREGTLRVGPRSAAADPGPACYGRGGSAPTVTDANLLLGYYDPDVFAGGVVLDVAAAEVAVDGLAGALGVDRLRAAWGIHEVATLDMEHAIRLVSINRGFDPREHALVCTGGAGPAHGPRLARALGAKVAVIPRAASGGSARGLLEASASTEVTRTALVRLDAEDAAERCAALVAELVKEAERGSFGAGGDSDVRLTLGIRYVGQGYELRVPIDLGAGSVGGKAAAARPENRVACGDPGLRSTGAIAEQFHRRYERAYGYRDDQPVEVVTWHLALVRPRRAQAGPAGEAAGAAPPVPGRRRAYFPETGLVEVDVYDRPQLRSCDAPVGPCLIAETTTTTVVLPGDRVEVAADGALLVHIGAAA